MNRRILILASLVLSAGLALTCLWTLAGAPATAQAGPEAARMSATEDTITVCLSGECDYDSIQTAVDAATGGDIIKVAAGVYDDVHQRDAVTQVVYISRSVTVRGGYTTADGFAEPPAPDVYVTRLDARGLGRGVTVTGTPGVELTGLHVTGGHADALPQDYGGGIFAVNARVTISGCRVYSNTARYGGGIQLRYSPNSLLANNDVYTNAAQFSAGIYLRHSPSSTLSGNVIHHNAADWGGGIYLSRSGNVTLTHNDVGSNTATSGGGGAFVNLSDGVRWADNHVHSNTVGTGHGGALRFRSSQGAVLTANHVYANVASSGGGLYLDSDSHEATLIDNYVHHNRAIDYGSGGGLYLGGDNVTLSGNEIFDNDSDDSGGGIYLSGDSSEFQANSFRGNTTSNWGGGLYLDHAQSATLARNQLFDNVGERGGAIASHNSDSVLLTATEITSNAAAYGGGLYLDGSHATLTNTMLTHNIANSRGAGAYLTSGTARLFHATLARNVGHQGVYLEAGSAAWIANTIVVSHTVGIEAGTASSATLEGTLWGAGAWANLTDTSTAVGGAVTTVADVRGEPAFAAPAAGDYHITGASAAIDAGVDAGVDVDIDGDPRPVRGGYDVGADEYVGCLASLNAGAVYTSVQAAIDASGSATDVVRVAGSCYEHDIVLDKTLTLQGGWSPDFSIRNPETHIATLDAEGRGRVMRIAAGSPVVEGLHIVNGSLSSGDGAGVYVGPAASPTVRHNHLTSNATGSQGQGGAICVDDSAAVTLDGNRIYGNSSGGAGGGVFIDSGSAVIVDNVIHGNTTWNVSDGGGIAIAAYSAASLERNTVTGNMAHRNGGGLTVGSRTLAMLINNIVADNACCDASGSVGGAGIWLGSGDHVLIHNTVADNEVSGDHGGVDAEAIRLYGDAVLTNTIIASHTVGVVVADADHTATLEGTLWHANGQDTSGAGTVVTGSVDLHQDPTFARPQADDYHLLDGSPAIDAGVPSGVREDVDGEARPRGRTYDIGADEYPDPIFFIYLPLVIRGS